MRYNASVTYCVSRSLRCIVLNVLERDVVRESEELCSLGVSLLQGTTTKER